MKHCPKYIPSKDATRHSSQEVSIHVHVRRKIVDSREIISIPIFIFRVSNYVYRTKDRKKMGKHQLIRHLTR